MARLWLFATLFCLMIVTNGNCSDTAGYVSGDVSTSKKDNNWIVYISLCFC